MSHAAPHPEQPPRSDPVARAAADAAAAMSECLLSTTCHELRNPLTAILLWSRILRSGNLDEQTRRQAIDTIERSAHAQAEMLEDLLDESRVHAGKIRLNIRAMDLSNAAAAAVKAAGVLAEAKKITLDTDYDPACGNVHADPVRIQQVIWNLLSNALKFTPTGGRVTLTLARDGPEVRIEVADTGQGIAPALLAHIFDDGPAGPEDPRCYSGVGLGLALARHLVELHGGSISAASPGPGQGAVFTAVIPLEPTTEGAAGNGASDEGFAASRALHGARVLLVEDQPDTRNVIRWLLEQSGAEVFAVESAAKARAILESAAGPRPTVMVSDIGMPGEDGFSLIRKVRAWESTQPANAPIPAIAITAYSGDAERRRALRLGFNAFMPKPLDPTELISWLAGVTSQPK